MVCWENGKWVLVNTPQAQPVSGCLAQTLLPTQYALKPDHQDSNVEFALRSYVVLSIVLHLGISLLPNKNTERNFP